MTTENENQFEQAWRLSIDSRLSNLERTTADAKSDVATYRLEVMKLNTDMEGRRRDAIDILTRDINDAKASLRTLKWVGGVIGGLVTTALTILGLWKVKP